MFSLESRTAIEDSKSNCKSCNACCNNKIWAKESPESSLSMSSIVIIIALIES